MTTTEESAESQPQLKRHIGVVGLLFASVGSIIGSGWLFGALNASQEAGPAAIISWALGGFLILLIALVYAELGVMFPLHGQLLRTRLIDLLPLAFLPASVTGVGRDPAGR